MMKAKFVAEPRLGNFIGESAVMQRVITQILRIAPHRSTVLITGESGTGKEQVARLIHLNSDVRNERMVTLNCAAVPETLLESELFGHTKGAFSGASKTKPGIFEEAHDGTLLLDEISEFPLMLQAKLLRVLQAGKFRRLGEVEERHTEVRVIATSSRAMEKEVAAGRFREDLFYRLNIFPIHVPPLRERKDDIPGLARLFIRIFCRDREPLKISDEMLAKLQDYHWPGNVRELQNKIERAVVLADSEYIQVSLPDEQELENESSFSLDIPDERVSIKQTLAELIPEVEKELIRRALRETQNNRTRAARLLEISHRSLLYKLKEYNCG
ncbi:sigma 54-interacting transcriptional regulator [bacterium]|nr:sigma 54-interacting transcriptional regulator [bacterium]